MQVLWIALGLIAVGLVGIVLGLRGRRVDDHPVCRKCRFDLAGISPGAEACPECGRALKKVRTGNRVRRRGLLLASLLVLTLGVVGAGAIGASLFAGPALNPHKPLWMLEMELRGTRVQRADDALSEILRRIDAGAIAPADAGRVVDRLLDLHARDASGDPVRWSSAIETLDGMGLVSTAQRARYFEQALRWRVRVRKTLQAGHALPLSLELFTPRIGRQREIGVEIRTKDGSIDGRSVYADSRFVDRLKGVVPEARPKIAATTYLIAGDLPEGEHEARVTLALTVRKPGMGLYEAAPAPLCTFEREVVLPFRITAGPTVEMVDPDEGLAAQMCRSIQPVRAILDEHMGTLHLSLRSDDPPMGAVFEVQLRAAGDASWQDTKQVYRIAPSQVGSMTMGLIIGDLSEAIRRGEAIDIRLVPSRERAEQSVEHVRIFGGQILLESVPIIRPPVRTKTPAGVGG